MGSQEIKDKSESVVANAKSEGNMNILTSALSMAGPMVDMGKGISDAKKMPQAKADGGVIEGEGTGKSDSIDAEVDAGNFVIPVDTPYPKIAEEIMKATGDTGKAKLKGGNSDVKLSDGEVLITDTALGNQIAIKNGLSGLSDLAPNADSTNTFKDGGYTDDDIIDWIIDYEGKHGSSSGSGLTIEQWTGGEAKTLEEAKELIKKKYLPLVKDFPDEIKARALDFYINSEDPRASLLVAAGVITPKEKVAMYKNGKLDKAAVEKAWKANEADVKSKMKSVDFAENFDKERLRSYKNTNDPSGTAYDKTWSKRVSGMSDFLSKQKEDFDFEKEGQRKDGPVAQEIEPDLTSKSALEGLPTPAENMITDPTNRDALGESLVDNEYYNNEDVAPLPEEVEQEPLNESRDWFKSIGGTAGAVSLLQAGIQTVQALSIGDMPKRMISDVYMSRLRDAVDDSGYGLSDAVKEESRRKVREAVSTGVGTVGRQTDSRGLVQQAMGRGTKMLVDSEVSLAARDQEAIERKDARADKMASDYERLRGLQDQDKIDEWKLLSEVDNTTGIHNLIGSINLQEEKDRKLPAITNWYNYNAQPETNNA